MAIYHGTNEMFLLRNAVLRYMAFVRFWMYRFARYRDSRWQICLAIYAVFSYDFYGFSSHSLETPPVIDCIRQTILYKVSQTSEILFCNNFYFVWTILFYFELKYSIRIISNCKKKAFSKLSFSEANRWQKFMRNLTSSKTNRIFMYLNAKFNLKN